MDVFSGLARIGGWPFMSQLTRKGYVPSNYVIDDTEAPEAQEYGGYYFFLRHFKKINIYIHQNMIILQNFLTFINKFM